MSTPISPEQVAGLRPATETPAGRSCGGPTAPILRPGVRRLGRRFSVVTTLGRTVGHTWDIARNYGVADICAGIHACDIPVVELETDPHARARILHSCRVALDANGSNVIVLGCAGMANLCSTLSDELGVPVVDGVAAATLQVEALVRQGLRTSKRGEFANPPVKSFA